MSDSMTREEAENIPMKITAEYNANTRALGDKGILHRDHLVMRTALTELFTRFGASDIKAVEVKNNNEHGYLGWVEAVVSGGAEHKRSFWQALDEENKKFQQSNGVAYKPYRVCSVG